MNNSPGDNIVYEASLAGPVNYHNYTKGNVGLGLDFPVDVMLDSPALGSMAGLGLVVDSILEDISYTSSSSDDTPYTSSPPLLGTRRSPKRAAPDSPWAEYAPMRTPSPSLRGGWTANLTLLLPAPAVPSLSSTPTAGAGLVPAMRDTEHTVHTPAFAGLGVGLPGYDDNTSIVVEPRSTPALAHAACIMSAVHICTPSHAGLGLGISGFDAAHIIAFDDADTMSPVIAAARTTVPVLARPGMRRALHRASIDDDNVCTPATSSLDSPAPTGAYAAPVFHAPAPRAQPRARLYSHTTLGLGFCNEEGEPMHMEGESTLDSPPCRRRFPIIEYSPL